MMSMLDMQGRLNDDPERCAMILSNAPKGLGGFSAGDYALALAAASRARADLPDELQSYLMKSLCIYRRLIKNAKPTEEMCGEHGNLALRLLASFRHANDWVAVAEAMATPTQSDQFSSSFYAALHTRGSPASLTTPDEPAREPSPMSIYLRSEAYILVEEIIDQVIKEANSEDVLVQSTLEVKNTLMVNRGIDFFFQGVRLYRTSTTREFFDYATELVPNFVQTLNPDVAG